MRGMTDRDHFAVAALTGLLARGLLQSNLLAADAYKVADAMLRERAKTNLDAVPEAIAPEPEPEAARRRPAGGTGDTTHDAAPAARASVESVAPQPTTRGESDRTDKAAPRPSEGTGDTQEPVAWGVASHFRVLATSISRMDAVDMQSDYAYHTEIVPLYRSPPVTEPMPKEKRAEVCAGPLAWAAIRENGQPLWLSYDRSGAEGMVNGMAEVVPLYRKPTLTDAEREAVEWFSRFGRPQNGPVVGKHAATLRGLLERLGGEK